MASVIKNLAVKELFQRYPPEVRKKLLLLRQLVLDTAAAIPEVGELEETLKWGEPSYISCIGSAIRMDWQPPITTHSISIAKLLWWRRSRSFIPTSSSFRARGR